ncbi:MAG: DUF3037 domain-containing protein [Myxococcota bacterium]
MPAPAAFSYAIIRVVPRVERGELINVGVILYSHPLRFLRARVELDEARLKALAPDISVDTVRAHLDAFCKVCHGDASAGEVARMPISQRFHWLVAPRSTIIQTSPTHAGLCQDAEQMLEHLMDTLVRTPHESNARSM